MVADTARPTVAVIIPAYDAAATLPACLAAISAMSWSADEVILFSDGSHDGTDMIARQAGARVIRNDGRPMGPSHGRNVAAAAARADLLLFVDADVVVAPDALEQLAGDMLEHRAQAAFGSYDDQPRSRRASSLYANLRHHFIHQHSRRDASTFWSGLGLIDRRLFVELGGYNAALFAHPSVEDIELGTRLLARGHKIRLTPAARAKHHKDWSLWRVWHTDVVRRAYPWSCLLADGRTAGADLNLGVIERVKAVAALCSLMILPLGILAPAATPLVAVPALGYLFLNRAFFVFLARRVPPPTLVKAIMMHWCYHIYAPTTYAVVMIQTLLGLRRPGPEAPDPMLAGFAPRPGHA